MPHVSLAKTHGRSFPVLMPQLWNSLPLQACQNWGLNVFQKCCESFLFRQALIKQGY